MPENNDLWIRIARTGTFKDSEGRQQSFGASDLDTIASTYDPAQLEAPLVFGHPKDSDPAYGWVKRLERRGEILFAQMAQVPSAVRELVENGRYRYVSMLNAIGEALVSGTLERFANEESPDGKKWEPSGRAWTQGLKSRRGRMGKTLQDTGRLRSSIDYAVTADSVLVGSEVEYARIHQMGGRAGRGHTAKIPARPYLGVSKADKAEIKAIMMWTSLPARI